MTPRSASLALAGALLTGPAAAADAAAPAGPPGRAVLASPLAGPLAVTASVHGNADALERRRALLTHLSLARRSARLRGDELAEDYARRARLRSTGRLRRSNRVLRRQIAELQAEERSPQAPGGSAGARTAVPVALQAIASCESGGNPAAVGGGGLYRGKYQFDRGTWAGVGGSGDPAAASEAEQDARAASLYARAGASPWPVCGR